MTWEEDRLRQIDQAGWFPPQSRLLLAVSGGSDSVALMHLLAGAAVARQWEMGIAHLDHGLRGPVSRQDAAFVRRRATSLGLRVHVRRQDVSARAAAEGQSIEMAARACRYAWFKTLRKRYGYTHLVLAHTRDDQAETVLLRLLRGSGIEGLRAMAPVSTRPDGVVIRPFLDCSKHELQQYLRERQLRWREDASNQDVAHTRNRIRHQVMPMLQSFNPRLPETLSRTAALLRQDHAILEEVTLADYQRCLPAETAPGGVALHLPPWRQLSTGRQRNVVHRWLLNQMERDAVTFDAVERVHQMCLCTSGTGRVSLPGRLTAIRQYDQLSIEIEPVRCHNRKKWDLHEGENEVPEWGLMIRVERTRGFRPVAQGRVGEYPAEAYLAASAVPVNRLRMRSWQPGDRIAPYGMTGTRKVQDIFTDAKIPAPQRCQIPLFECHGHMVWIPGYRIAASAAVESATAAALHIQVRKAE